MFGAVSGTWYVPPSTPAGQTVSGLSEDGTAAGEQEGTEGGESELGMGKEYVYDEEEEGEIRESEGRWKR